MNKNNKNFDEHQSSDQHEIELTESSLVTVDKIKEFISLGEKLFELEQSVPEKLPEFARNLFEFLGIGATILIREPKLCVGVLRQFWGAYQGIQSIINSCSGRENRVVNDSLAMLFYTEEKLKTVMIAITKDCILRNFDELNSDQKAQIIDEAFKNGFTSENDINVLPAINLVHEFIKSYKEMSKWVNANLEVHSRGSNSNTILEFFPRPAPVWLNVPHAIDLVIRLQKPIEPPDSKVKDRIRITLHRLSKKGVIYRKPDSSTVYYDELTLVGHFHCNEINMDVNYD